MSKRTHKYTVLKIFSFTTAIPRSWRSTWLTKLKPGPTNSTTATRFLEEVRKPVCWNVTFLVLSTQIFSSMKETAGSRFLYEQSTLFLCHPSGEREKALRFSGGQDHRSLDARRKGMGVRGQGSEEKWGDGERERGRDFYDFEILLLLSTHTSGHSHSPHSLTYYTRTHHLHTHSRQSKLSLLCHRTVL